MKVALNQRRAAAAHLGESRKRSTGARGARRYAPRIETFKIATDKIREVIGTGRQVIREIVEKPGAKINVGRRTVKVASATASRSSGGHWISRSVGPESHIYEGTSSNHDFGAFVNSSAPRLRSYQHSRSAGAETPTSSRKATK